ncbi:hypothetical protein GCM10011611_25810 [Aliidongia dinghuensis]|uniref:Uncharacterized protein n=1 Tax=Aliidongia dinghuensis TaxID=1867774 RepID=A0A8J3E524_9PROT|nr:hypothetical protein [Aliidongia dinghuensis]GGF18768.1 hypothetical protein GCM10011611_25810 [Aliidongia dinghuensis]
MAEPDPPFYVGYLKLPRGLRGFLAGVLVLLVILDVGLALLLFGGQKPHASGAWGTEGEVAYTGQFQARPYPLLRLAATRDRPAGAVLLADEGKIGAPDGLDELDGAMVEARGYPILRGDLTVLQLDQAPVRQDASVMAPLPAAAPEAAMLEGEIVDAKCYAGAMNPGEGKAHEACGSFCLYGGIPALFVTRADDGSLRWYLMAASDGGPVGEAARALVGRPVRLAGTISRGAGLAIFSVTPDQLAEVQSVERRMAAE